MQEQIDRCQRMTADRVLFLIKQCIFGKHAAFFCHFLNITDRFFLDAAACISDFLFAGKNDPCIAAIVADSIVTGQPGMIRIQSWIGEMTV